METAAAEPIDSGLEVTLERDSRLQRGERLLDEAIQRLEETAGDEAGDSQVGAPDHRAP